MKKVWYALAVFALVALTWREMDLLGDTFWYVATGRWVLEHHAWPQDELFSYAATRGPWLVNMPLSEPAFAWLADRFGMGSLVVVCSAFFALGWSLLWLPHAKTDVARLATAPLVVLAIWLQRDDLSARSQAIADLFVAILFLAMFRMRDGLRVPIWLAPLLGAVWMNIHPTVFVGAIVPIGFGAAIWITGRPARAAMPYLVFAALLSLGMLANPYGARLPLEFVRVMGAESTFAVDLFQSPNFRAPEILAPLLLALVLVALLARRRDARPEALVMLALAMGTCIARRYVEILLAFEIVVASRMIAQASWAQRAIPPRTWAALAALPIALAAASLRGPKDPFRNVPVDAVRAIDAQNLPDNVINVLHWGGYLDWVWAGKRRDFMDGRTTQFENGVIGDHTILLNAAPGSRELLDMYLVNTVLWERDTPLDFALARDPAWVNVFREGFAVVYVRKEPIR